MASCTQLGLHQMPVPADIPGAVDEDECSHPAPSAASIPTRTATRSSGPTHTDSGGSGFMVTSGDGTDNVGAVGGVLILALQRGKAPQCKVNRARL